MRPRPILVDDKRPYRMRWRSRQRRIAWVKVAMAALLFVALVAWGAAQRF